MKVPVLSVYDNLIGYGTTFTAQNESVAVRGFTNSIISNLEGGNIVDVSPVDLSLYLVGYFDTLTGDLSPCEPSALVRGTAIVAEYHNNRCSCASDSGGDSVDVN